MRLLEEHFETEAEARAFIAGVELANDSDLGVHEPRMIEGKCTVYVHDWAGDEDDVCPICGAGGDEDGLLCDHAQDDLDHRVEQENR